VRRLEATVNAPVDSVTFAGVTKRFGSVVAVRELDLGIRRGEFFTLLGPSGCGKTTTLRMIAGFEDPTEGHLLIDGEAVAGLPPDKRSTNTVFQSYALFPHLSVRDNVAFGLRRTGVPKAEIEERVRGELERVGLTGETSRRPSQLSGGQQQRVALARALVNLPKVLLLDEPLGALDLKLRKGLQIELKRIQRDVGITFVYVTHDQDEALTMSDRIAVMNGGRVEQVAPAEEIYERPATTFVADFIGVSNLMPGTVASAGGGRGRVRLDAGPEFEAELADVPMGARCHAVVRPERLRIAPTDAPPDGRPSMEGLLTGSVFHGSAIQLLVRLDDDTEVTVFVPNSGDMSAVVPPTGAPVRLSWSRDDIHVVRESAPPDAATA
jgi:spermidine/putrescine transport system ATP-binding protein